MNKYRTAAGGWRLLRNEAELEVDEKHERNDEGVARGDYIGNSRMLRFYRPWDCPHFALGSTRLSAPVHLVFGPRLLCPLAIGVSHATGGMAY